VCIQICHLNFKKKNQSRLEKYSEGDYKGATDHVQDFLCIIGKLINFKTLILPKEHIYMLGKL
jgi:hypothetical protein